MNKKIILFVSVIAVFLMVMVPNIDAVEYHTLKEKIVEKNVNVGLAVNAIWEKFENFLELPTTLIVLITAILQALFIICMYLFGQLILTSADNLLIGFIFSMLSGMCTGFIISKWSRYIENNFELSELDELILNFLPIIIYYIFGFLYIIFSFNDSSQKDLDNTLSSRNQFHPMYKI